MEELIKLEKFEIEVLEYLSSGKFLDKLVFVGGTMLRLCYGLNRFSNDLDFWVIGKMDFNKLFKKLKEHLEKKYTVKDAMNKFFTILFEISSPFSSRNIKIEIRKEIKKIKYEKTIAFSKYSNIQVLLNTLSLEDTLKFKIESFIDRKEIRDCFDIEFLCKSGVELKVDKKLAQSLLKTINQLSTRDYKVKLGAIIEKRERDYYIKKNFEFLKNVLNRIIFSEKEEGI